MSQGKGPKGRPAFPGTRKHIGLCALIRWAKGEEEPSDPGSEPSSEKSDNRERTHDNFGGTRTPRPSEPGSESSHGRKAPRISTTPAGIHPARLRSALLAATCMALRDSFSSLGQWSFFFAEPPNAFLRIPPISFLVGSSCSNACPIRQEGT